MLEHPYSWSNPDTPVEKRGELHEKGFIYFHSSRRFLPPPSLLVP